MFKPVVPSSQIRHEDAVDRPCIRSGALNLVRAPIQRGHNLFAIPVLADERHQDQRILDRGVW